jgi:Spy/CpxP family protein refolding chaperone
MILTHPNASFTFLYVFRVEFTKNRSTLNASTTLHGRHRRQATNGAAITTRRHDMNARKITFILLAAALIVAPGILIAQGGPGGGQEGCFGKGHGRGGPDGGGGGMLLGKFGDKLDLSDEQRAEIEAIMTASRDEGGALREQMQELRTAYRETHEPGVFDEAAIRAHAAEVAAIQVEMQVHRARTHADVYNVLTPEQQEELKELMELFNDRPRRGGRRGGPGGY